jgi:hypothetical protein
MWDRRLQPYGAVMQFIAGHFNDRPAERVAPGRPSRGTSAVRPLVTIVIVSALTVGTFTGVAKAVRLLSGQISSVQNLNEKNASSMEVIDAFLSAQSVDDADAAAAEFEIDAVIADTAGRTTTGTNAVRRLIGSLNGWEAGPRQANGNEVIWAESLPIWKLPDAPSDLDLRLEQEVPHYASTQWMCAIVTNGKIQALTLAAGRPRSCKPALT